MIDWSKPLEAFHDAKGVAPMRVIGERTPDGYYKTAIEPAAESNEWWHADGCDAVPGSGWRIRNILPAWRTSDEQLDRMDALLLRLAGAPPCAPGRLISVPSEDILEAKVILAAREPIDPQFTALTELFARDVPLMGECARARLARDVLKALASA